MKLIERIVTLSLALAVSAFAQHLSSFRISVEENREHKDNVLEQGKTVEHGYVTTYYPRVTANTQ